MRLHTSVVNIGRKSFEWMYLFDDAI